MLTSEGKIVRVLFGGSRQLGKGAAMREACREAWARGKNVIVCKPGYSEHWTRGPLMADGEPLKVIVSATPSSNKAPAQR